MRQGGRYGAALAARPFDLKLGDVSATIGFVHSFRRGWKSLLQHSQLGRSWSIWSSPLLNPARNWMGRLTCCSAAGDADGCSGTMLMACPQQQRVRFHHVMLRE